MELGKNLIFLLQISIGIEQKKFYFSDFFNSLLNKCIVRGWRPDQSEKEWEDIWNSVRLAKKLNDEGFFQGSSIQKLRNKRLELPEKANGKKSVNTYHVRSGRFKLGHFA